MSQNGRSHKNFTGFIITRAFAGSAYPRQAPIENLSRISDLDQLALSPTKSFCYQSCPLPKHVNQPSFRHVSPLLRTFSTRPRSAREGKLLWANSGSARVELLSLFLSPDSFSYVFHERIRRVPFSRRAIPFRLFAPGFLFTFHCTHSTRTHARTLCKSQG